MQPESAASQIKRRAGFSVPEVLLVCAILGLGVAVALPFVTSKVRETKLRSSAGQFVVTLRAARMVAVTAGTRIPVTVTPHGGGGSLPGNSYEYMDTAGKLRRVELPRGVRIVSSDSPIVFMPNGSVEAPQPPVTRFQALHVPEEWTVETSLGGVPLVTHQPRSTSSDSESPQ
jgi:Tfp pilus assembly protein FimT